MHDKYNHFQLRRWLSVLLIATSCIFGLSWRVAGSESTALPGRKVDNDLIKAVKSGKSTIARYLLAIGANPNIEITEGWTVLMEAAEKGNKTMFDSLLSRGANPKARRYDGFTTLMAAARGGNEYIYIKRYFVQRVMKV